MIKEGTEVRWKFSAGDGRGRIKKIFWDVEEIEINGVKVKACASKERPAYLIEKEDGSQIIKLAGDVDTIH